MRLANRNWGPIKYRFQVEQALAEGTEPPAPVTNEQVAELPRFNHDLATKWDRPVRPELLNDPTPNRVFGVDVSPKPDAADRYRVDKPAIATPPRTDDQRLRLDLIDGAEFDAGDYAVEDLIPGVLTCGEPGQIVGPMKACKTTIAVDMILSLAFARPFLGKFPIHEAAPAGIVSAESGRATLQETARRIAASKGVRLADATGAFWGFDLPPLTDDKAIAAIESAIADRGLRLLILDPFYLMLGSNGDEGNVFSMGEWLKPIGELCQRTGATILLAHHARKNRPDHTAPLELHEISWSGSAEFVRQWLLLARRSPFDAVNGKHELWLSYGGSAGHSGVWGLDITEGHRSDDGGRVYVPELIPASDARQEANEAKGSAKAEERQARNESIMAKRQQHVARYLARFPDGDTEARIGSGCSMAP